MDVAMVIERTRRWISSVVIELDLCPFARRVYSAGLIRFAVTDSDDAPSLLCALSDELEILARTPADEVETTLLIHPLVLRDFLDYNEFLGTAEQKVRDQGLTGVIQIASFHPDYRFAGAAEGAAENYTNCSPYAMLHLLREESITRVAGDPNSLLKIPERNQATLRGLGKEQMAATLRAIQTGVVATD